MGRRAKPSKEKVDAKRARARTSPRNDDSNGRDLEKRLTEALKREVAIPSRATDAAPLP